MRISDWSSDVCSSDLLFFKQHDDQSRIYGIETSDELVQKSQALAQKLSFPGMSFLNLSVAEAIVSDRLPQQIAIVTALPACNTATDDAIPFEIGSASCRERGCQYV